MPAVTIDFTAAQVTRALKAFGRHWNLRDAQGGARDATPEEVRQYLIRQVRGIVVREERLDAEAKVVEPPPFNPA